jgi:hypothetical protein
MDCGEKRQSQLTFEVIHDFVGDGNFVECLDLLEFLDAAFGEVAELLVVIVVESTVASLVR